MEGFGESDKMIKISGKEFKSNAYNGFFCTHKYMYIYLQGGTIKLSP